MAFEDVYFRSPSQGLLNLRYSPNDRAKQPISAILQPEEASGVFCVAKVSEKYGYQVKKSLTAEKFSLIKDQLLFEIEVSEAEMQPELKRVIEREEALEVAGDVEFSIWKNFTDNEKTPIRHAELTAQIMTNAITYWAYEEYLCTASAFERFTRN